MSETFDALEGLFAGSMTPQEIVRSLEDPNTPQDLYEILLKTLLGSTFFTADGVAPNSSVLHLRRIWGDPRAQAPGAFEILAKHIPRVTPRGSSMWLESYLSKIEISTTGLESLRAAYRECLPERGVGSLQAIAGACYLLNRYKGESERQKLEIFLKFLAEEFRWLREHHDCASIGKDLSNVLHPLYPIVNVDLIREAALFGDCISWTGSQEGYFSMPEAYCPELVEAVMRNSSSEARRLLCMNPALPDEDRWWIWLHELKRKKNKKERFKNQIVRLASQYTSVPEAVEHILHLDDRDGIAMLAQGIGIVPPEHQVQVLHALFKHVSEADPEYPVIMRMFANVNSDLQIRAVGHYGSSAAVYILKSWQLEDTPFFREILKSYRCVSVMTALIECFNRSVADGKCENGLPRFRDLYLDEVYPALMDLGVAELMFKAEDCRRRMLGKATSANLAQRGSWYI